MLQKKALIIRFSSFGDIVQSAFAAKALGKQNYSVDLITKDEFRNAFSSGDFGFTNVLGFSKSSTIGNLWRLTGFAAEQDYALIYDAHNNQRSLLFKFLLCLRSPKFLFRLKKRSKFRFKRFLLFKFRINKFPKPFKGAESFLDPLDLKIVDSNSLKSESKRVLLAPSAAWDLKKWPEDKWIELARELQSDHEVAFLGGPSDDFIGSLHRAVPGSVNLAGLLSWSQTISEIKKAKAIISGDTGVLHVADFFGVPSVALMGPSAFGFPSRKSSQVIFKDLPCQPCSKDGRGECKIKETKKCLTSIEASEVIQKLKKETT
jgi:heptosyltransferase-2